MSKFILTPADILKRVQDHMILQTHGYQGWGIYGVPRGGVPVAMLAAAIHGYTLVDSPDAAQIIIDDLIDSGATMAKYPGKLFLALYDKRDRSDPAHGRWVVFPWEESVEKDMDDHAARILQGLGKEVNPHTLAVLQEFAASLE